MKYSRRGKCPGGNGCHVPARGSGPLALTSRTSSLEGFGSTFLPATTMPPRAESRDREERHGDRKRHHHTRRSRSPRGDEDQHRHKRHRSRSPRAKPVALPYKAKPLSKRQYDEYRPLFQSYLDIQKQIQLDDLDEREVKGRWKSFISRWYAYKLHYVYATPED